MDGFSLLMRSPSGVVETELAEDVRNSSIERIGGGAGQHSYRVLVHGLEFFCERLPAAFETDGWEIRHNSVHSLSSLFALLRDVRRADLLFTWGARISFGKFLHAARLLNKEKVVLFWSGSDVIGARMQFAEGIFEPWIADKIHWAGAPWLAEEIRGIGLKCEYVPITWVPAVQRPHPLPEKFSVLVYLPAARQSQLYGLGRILEVSRSLPHIPFELVGLVEGQVPDPPANLRICGRIQDMSEVYRRTSVYWRPVSHDGLSFMSLEALSYGRHVLWSYPFPHCRQSSNVDTDRAEILRLHALHESKILHLNEPGIAMVSERFSLTSIKRDYLERWRGIILSSAESNGKFRRK